jgi:hypothetical protein
LVRALLIVPKLLLIASLVTILRDDMAVKGEMEHQVLDDVVSLEIAVFVGELGGVVGRLGVISGQGLNNVGLALLGG